VVDGEGEANMEQYSAIALCRSMAGHDRDSLYLLMDQEGRLCFLCDGKTRPLNHPKKKNRAHVQIITHLPVRIREEMAQITSDADVRRILRSYQKMNGGTYVENRCD
jgi:hypothetical protein